MYAFLVLMQNGEGVVSKRVSYVKEKWDLLDGADNPERYLDATNRELYQKLLKINKLQGADSGN